MKGFSKLDNPNHKGQTDEWLTPLSIINKLGEFDFDPCGYQGHETAKKVITLPVSGLTVNWHGRVWLNPPYSDVGTWLDKLMVHGNGIALVFARTDTRWLQKHLRVCDSAYFLKGRIKFLNNKFVTKTNAGHGSVFLAYGERPMFEKHFDGWRAK